MLITEAILIAKDMRVLLTCNHPQSQDVSTQTIVCKSRIISGDSPSLVSLENSQMMRTAQVIPLMPWSSDLE